MMGQTKTRATASLNPTGISERVLWLDVARGICMILVVFMHFDEMFYSKFATWQFAANIWDTLSSAARPARIPTFFLISGILASASLDRPWAKIIEKRLAIQYYAFMLWALVHTIILYSVFTNMDAAAWSELVVAYAGKLFWPTTQIWFLWALVAFFLIAMAFRRIPYVALAISLVMFLFAEYASGVGVQMLRSLGFFLFGIYFPSVAKRVGARRGLLVLAGLFCAYAASVALIILLGEEAFGVWLPATLIGAALVFQISNWLTLTPLSGVLSYIGKQTLPIYVMHGAILMVVSFFVREYGLSFGPSNLGKVGDALLPIAGNVGLIALCIGLYHVAQRAGGYWLFAPPKMLMSYLRSYSPPTAQTASTVTQ